jgi:hypothetical protein
VTRVVDRGAIVAAYVGIGMAVTIAISFLLVIPIEPIYWLLALPAGLLIGYYANQRSDRRAGPWSRIVVNALFAGLVTGLTLVAFLLVVKALFFFGDSGYPGSRSRRPATAAPAASTPAMSQRATAQSSRPPGSPTRRRSRASTGDSRCRRRARSSS